MVALSGSLRHREFMAEDAAIAKGTFDPVGLVVLSEKAALHRVSSPRGAPSRSSSSPPLTANPRPAGCYEVWLKLLERISVTRGPHLIERRPGG
jgi:hypothetical protein